MGLQRGPMEPRLLEAARGQKTDRTPVWLMRQAGRYLPGYQKLKEKYSFLELCKNPELVAEISLEPYRLFGVDGVILFSDIMIPAEAMGMRLHFNPGPFLESPIRTEKDIKRLSVADPLEKTPFVLEALRMIKSEIANKSALIGFSGCPFTTATYMIEGKQVPHFPTLKKFMKERPKHFHQLLEKLVYTIVPYLKAQIMAGADVVMIFDSATYLLTQKEYLEFAFPYEQKIMEGLRGLAPVILFLRDTKRFIHDLKRMPPSILSVDHHMSLAEARAVLGKDVILQGNLDPQIVSSKNHVKIREETERILRSMKGERHIFNLGHGVLKETPPDNVSYLIDVVRNYAS